MGGKEIKIKPLPHIKPLPREPDFDEKRAEFNDTWYFSRRVPMPADAVKN